MIKEEKSNEMTRQFDDIYREHHDPDIRDRKRRKLEKEKRLKEKKEDLGI